MTENQKAVAVVVIVFVGFIGFQVFANLIPSIVNNNPSSTKATVETSYKDTIKTELQSALEQYLKINDNNPPKYFSDFVAYQNNKPKKFTISLDKFASNFDENEPVSGLETKTLVLKIKDPASKKVETAVYLLNMRYVSLANI